MQVFVLLNPDDTVSVSTEVQYDDGKTIMMEGYEGRMMCPTRFGKNSICTVG